MGVSGGYRARNWFEMVRLGEGNKGNVRCQLVARSTNGHLRLADYASVLIPQQLRFAHRALGRHLLLCSAGFLTYWNTGHTTSNRAPTSSQRLSYQNCSTNAWRSLPSCFGGVRRAIPSSFGVGVVREEPFILMPLAKE